MLNDEQFAKLEKAVISFNSGKPEEAYDTFRVFAEKPYNDDESQYYLGLMYYSGKVVEKSLDQAIFWWKKSAFQRNMDAAFQLESISMTKNTRY